MESSGYYDIRIFYNCRMVVLPSDTDSVVFVNNERNRWLDGPPLSIDDVLGVLAYYGQDRIKPREERTFKADIVFVDGEGMHYGNWIRFDDAGRPLVKVVNGRIYATNVVSRFELDEVVEGELTMQRLFELLSRAFDTAWASDAHEAFYAYFTGTDCGCYRLYVSEDYVGLESWSKGFFGWERWGSISHEHIDAKGDDMSTVLAAVRYYLHNYAR